ncbi:hypothetical protein AcW2_005348 [Taiwanofungus camphoratus]|nr:hypothetical protein AcW2_005348 [Antrodia cinnamomea]
MSLTNASIQSPSSTSPASSAVVDWLKPQRSEAVVRLRTNTIGFVTFTVLTNLLPFPSPWTAFAVLRERSEVNIFYYGLCAFEVFVLAVLGLNVLQASYALKYPRASHPLPPSPAKSISVSSPPRQWRLSPNSSPQRQKSFSYASSPVSTPSRILNYTIPPTASTPADASFSSFGSVPASPASPLAAYRGRRSTAAGRAFDGALLSRLARDDSDDDE